MSRSGRWPARSVKLYLRSTGHAHGQSEDGRLAPEPPAAGEPADVFDYDPNDPVWFFSIGTHDVPANFAGRVGAFLSELSYQMLGYASYLIPAVIAVAGWHYFWCRAVDAIYTKLIGAAMLFACGAAFLALYAPYLERQDAELRDLRASEALQLAPDFPFAAIPGLSNEMIERLGAARPATLAAAGRIPGVTPAALAALLVHARRRERSAA